MIPKSDCGCVQSGVILLEALLAILVFSVGILALVGLQAAAVKQSSDARYRTEAALLANEILGQMWVSDRTVTTLQTNFATGESAADYKAWADKVKGRLPGAANAVLAPDVAVGVDGTVTITVKWLAPNEPANASPHSYVVVAQIK